MTYYHITQSGKVKVLGDWHRTNTWVRMHKDKKHTIVDYTRGDHLWIYALSFNSAEQIYQYHAVQTKLSVLTKFLQSLQK